MARTTTVLDVFVASPNDLVEERKILEEVVAEYNSIWAVDRHIELHLVKWETHTRPGFSSDPQNVINEQIGDKYDIFIGIMWARFGSPTPRAESGTQEEFERAFERFKTTGGAVQIMLYFKDAPLSPSQIDPTQLEKVCDFKHRVSTQYGGLYHQFVSPEDFRELLRLHLARVVQDTLGAASPALANNRLREPTQLTDNVLSNFEALATASEEQGIIELTNDGLEAIRKATEILDHISRGLNEFTDSMNARAKQLQTAKSEKLLQNNNLVKRVSDGAAADIELYVQRMLIDVPALSSEYSTAMDKFGRVAMLSGSDLDEPLENVERFLGTLQNSRATIAQTRSSVKAMRDAMASTPRMTTAYNHARRRVIAITDDFLAFLDRSADQTAEVESIVQEIAAKRRN